MIHLKLFENFVNKEFKIYDVVLSVNNILFFSINNINFYIDLNKSTVINDIFIDVKSPTLEYIKSKQFIDDLQDILFEKDIYDYSAEEIQYIILKTGLCKEQELINYIKDIFSNYKISKYKNYSKYVDRFTSYSLFDVKKDMYLFISLTRNPYYIHIMNTYNINKYELGYLLRNYIIEHILNISNWYINDVRFDW